jgi:hypothetical protein
LAALNLAVQVQELLRFAVVVTMVLVHCDLWQYGSPEKVVCGAFVVLSKTHLPQNWA